MTKHVPQKKDSFLSQVIEATPGGERLLNCLQCGSCGGSCPSGADMTHSPRTIFAMIKSGDRKGCFPPTRCGSASRATSHDPLPARGPVADMMSTLKRISIAQRLYHHTDAPALAKAFTDFVDKYGRSFEFGLATGYYLLNRPLQALKTGPMGLAMLSRGRMALTPTRIKNIEQLQAIIRKAKELSREERKKLESGGRSQNLADSCFLAP